MHFEKFILTILFQNAKLNIKKRKKRKSNRSFSKTGLVRKEQANTSFLGLMCFISVLVDTMAASSVINTVQMTLCLYTIVY